MPRTIAPQAVAACSIAEPPSTLPLMGVPSVPWIAPPSRLIDLWDARRARGAEPLFHPTIGAAIRAGRPWFSCYCRGCGVVGQIDLGTIDRHRERVGLLRCRFVAAPRCKLRHTHASLGVTIMRPEALSPRQRAGPQVACVRETCAF